MTDIEGGSLERKPPQSETVERIMEAADNLFISNESVTSPEGKTRAYTTYDAAYEAVSQETNLDDAFGANIPY